MGYLLFYGVVRRHLGYSNLEIVSGRYLKNGSRGRGDRNAMLLINLSNKHSLVHGIGQAVIEYEDCGRKMIFKA